MEVVGPPASCGAWGGEREGISVVVMRTDSCRRGSNMKKWRTSSRTCQACCQASYPSGNRIVLHHQGGQSYTGGVRWVKLTLSLYYLGTPGFFYTLTNTPAHSEEGKREEWKNKATGKVNSAAAAAAGLGMSAWTGTIKLVPFHSTEIYPI